MLPVPTAQLVALACHFNGRARGLNVENFFPSSSTCNFCASLHFSLHPNWMGLPLLWRTETLTADDWLTREATTGRSAWIVHQNPEYNYGDWLLVTMSDSSVNAWKAVWVDRHPNAPGRRICSGRYRSAWTTILSKPPGSAPLTVLHNNLQTALEAILSHAERYQFEDFAERFRQAIDCLASDEPFSSVYHQDLCPAGLLELPAMQMLAACQPAWVFGGMGWWEDLAVAPQDEAEHARLGQRLYTLISKCLMASTNSAVG